jgi:CubicO group peptidase (beta-lactamase class C family)
MIAATAACGSLLPAAAQDACPVNTVPVAADCVATKALAATIHDTVLDYGREADLTGVIVSISVGDTLVLREALGTSMAGTDATPDMHFRNGAVAIAYMSTVLLRLQEEGVLGLDDSLSKWFPDYPRADEVTLRMLTASTSGYADYVNLDILPLYEDPFRRYLPFELIDMGLSQPMACDPGTCFAYAHTNYVILGQVMEKAAGKPLADLIAEYVLDPLGLENTRSETSAFIQQPVLHAFTAERGVFEDSTYWNPSWTLAEGAVMTTDIDDLAASARAVGDGELLSPESHASQIAPVTAGMGPFTDAMYYGLGVLVTNDWVLQTPSFAGYAAAMAYLPSKRITIAIASTNGPKTPETPRPTDVLFLKLGALLAPDAAPKLGR